MKLKGTKTEKNILTAFAGESQARNRYTFFAGQALKDGYVQVARAFEETADHERAHAKRLFKLLDGGELEISAAFPAGVIGTTMENLEASVGGERHEHEVMYPEFAKIAREEGLDEVADIFLAIARSEVQHERRFLGLLNNIKAKTVFTKPDSTTWRCLNCGYVEQGKAAPEVCPACDHPQAHFELLAENW